MLGVGSVVDLCSDLRPARLERVGHVLEEDQPEHDVLVLSRIHVAAELVCRRP
jgi:hypothetical protein